MTNPFHKTPAQAPAPQASGYNPFSGSNEVADRLPLMSEGVIACGKVIGYYVVPKTPQSGTYVYVDLELLEVPQGEDMKHKPGARVTHRIGGFESSGVAKAQASLRELNQAICPEIKNDPTTDYTTLPYKLQESEEILGRKIWIQTKLHVTKNIGKDGKPVTVVKGEYQPAE